MGILWKKVTNGVRWKIKTAKYQKHILTTDKRLGTQISKAMEMVPIPKNLDITKRIYHNHWCQHSFDVLGSGPIEIGYNKSYSPTKVAGEQLRFTINEFDNDGNWLSHVVHSSHLTYSKLIWKKIISINPKYAPIDWQLDVKSGFRWNSKLWYKAQGSLSKNKKGVDIKIPWELSRLQHLPSLVLVAQKSTDEERIALISEVVCQILDFIMANPIGMGVNFNCPMDIGIRNANVLLALDWCDQIDNTGLLNEDVKSILYSYISASTTHILENIEYREGLTSNHYLGNVLGVLYAGAYLNDDPKADHWLYFGIQEIESCMQRQFFNDGTNFEGSTSYHRLSAEMMAWASLLLLQTPSTRLKRLQDLNIKEWEYTPRLTKSVKRQVHSSKFVLSNSFWTKLVKSAKFCEVIAKPNGDACQFGDNDSGRFTKLTMFGSQMPTKQAKGKYANLHNVEINSDAYFDENSLNHGAFISSVKGLLQERPCDNHFSKAEYEIFKYTSNSISGFSDYLKSLTPYNFVLERHVNEFVPLQYHKSKEFSFENALVDFTIDTSLDYFEDFQLVVLKNDSFYLALAGISNPKQHHSLGHTHNDKLSIELQVDRQDILFNPGTYVYTADPNARYEFRSVKSHNTVSVNGQEQNTPLPGNFGLFNLKFETRFELIKLTKTEIVAVIKYRNIIHQRRIKIKQRSIVIDDWCNHTFEQHWNFGKPYSNGYGKRLK